MSENKGRNGGNGKRQAQTARPIKASLKRKRKLQVKWKSAAGNEAYKWPARWGKEAARAMWPQINVKGKDFHSPTPFSRQPNSDELLNMANVKRKQQKMRRKKKKCCRLMKPPSRVAMGQVCTALQQQQLQQRVQAACGLPEWALKWTPQWMCAAWQIRKVSFEIKQHLLPILNYISDKLCPRPCLNSTQRVFPTSSLPLCIFFELRPAAPCSSSFSLALAAAALTDLTTLSSWLPVLEAKPGACSFQTFDTETNFGKRVLPTEASSRSSSRSSQPTVVATRRCSHSLFLSLSLSHSLSRCAFSGFSFFCWLQYFIAFAVRVLHTFERRWGLP